MVNFIRNKLSDGRSMLACQHSIFSLSSCQLTMGSAHKEYSDKKNLLAGLVTGSLSPANVPEAQWPGLIEEANRQELGPILFWVLTQSSGVNRMSFSNLDVLEKSARLTAEKNALLKSAQLQINQAMSGVGIPIIWLKGIVLDEYNYPLPGLRVMADIDGLTPYETREQALNVAASLGFHPQALDDYTEKLKLPEQIQYHDPLFGGPGNILLFELHYQLTGPDSQHLLTAEKLAWIWSQLQARETHGQSISVLKPEAHLLYLCAHAILQHGEAVSKLARYMDLHWLVSTSDLDWSLIVEKAIDFHWSYAVERALALAVDYFRTPLPGWVIPALEQLRLPTEDIRYGQRLAGSQVDFERNLIILRQSTWVQRMRRISAILFPPEDFMRQRYALSPDQPLFPAYFRRWMDLGRIAFQSLRSRLSKP